MPLILKEIEISKIAVQDVYKKRDIDFENNLLIDDPIKLINDPSIDVIVEVMGGINLAKEIILKSLKAGKSVVTANKAVIADMAVKYMRLLQKRVFMS